MAGFGLGNYINPAVGGFIDQRRNALAGLGAGLLQGRPGAGVQEGIAQDDAYATMKKAEAERQKNLNQTQQWIKANFPQYSNLPADQGWQAAIADLAAQRNAASGDNLTTDQRNWMFAQENPDFASFLNEGGSGVEYGLTPQWYQMQDGTYGFGVVGKDGSFKAVTPPDGATMLDPRSLATEKAYGTKLGGAQGEATAAAPGDIASANSALDLIGQIRTHPELRWATGTMAGLGANAVPGTGRFDFQNLVDQAKSGAFLTAVQEMRGLGALSNAEGGAATQAITRMNTATSTEAFLKALDDYEAIVVKGLERAQGRLAAPGPGTPANTGRGSTYTYNPATGELE